MGFTADRPIAPNSVKRQFRRPRFTLAALLVLITVIAIPLGYLAQRRAWNTKRIVAYKALHARNITLKLWHGRGQGGLTTNPSLIEKIWNGISLDSQFPTFTCASLQDKDGANGPLASPNDDDLLALSAFDEIEEIYIAHADEVTDAGLAAVAKAPKLKVLQLQSMSQVTGSFLVEFGSSSKLTTLWLSSLPSLEGERLSAFSGLTDLRSLKLLQCSKLSDPSLKKVALPNQIEHLSLAELNITDNTVSRWLGQTRPKSLALNVGITRALATALATQTQLESLSISNAPLNDADLAFLSQCKQLQSLLINGAAAKGAFLQKMQSAQSLRFLCLANTPLTDEHAVALRRFDALQSLDLKFTPIRGECFQLSGDWPTWGTLCLIGTEFDEEGKEALAKMNGPKIVELPMNWGMSDFSRCPNGAPAFQWTIYTKMQGTAPGKIKGFSATHEIEMALVKIDRCPKELMEPVIRLHEIARAKANE
jgi:hypothetical protein